MKEIRKDFTGKIFGDIKVLGISDVRSVKQPHLKRWICKCNVSGCGLVFEAFGSNLTSGNTKSCGCKTKKLGGISVSNNSLYCSYIKKRKSGLLCEQYANDFNAYYARVLELGYTDKRHCKIGRIDKYGIYSFENMYVSIGDPK
jgi:hypothetical protein